MQIRTGKRRPQNNRTASNRRRQEYRKRSPSQRIGVPRFLRAAINGSSNTPAPIQRELADTGYEALEAETPGNDVDNFEAEADRLAESVAKQSGNKNASNGNTVENGQEINANTPEESTRTDDTLVTESEDTQESENDTQDLNVSPSSAGKPIPDNIREKTEAMVGTDLSAVRVHDDSNAQRDAAALNAKAFTHNNHIYLGRGQSIGDEKLIAHESVHAAQQSQNSLIQTPQLKPKAGWRKASITVRWTTDSTEFYHRVIRAIARKRAFRGVGKSALWQPFDSVIRPFMRLYARHHPGLKEGQRITFRARLWFDPERFHGSVSGAALYEHEPETAPAKAAEKPKLDFTEKIDEIEKTFLQHMKGFQTALDQLDVAALAMIAQLLELDWYIMEQIHEKLKVAKPEDYVDLETDLIYIRGAKASFWLKLPIAVSLQEFRGQAIIGSYQRPPNYKAPISYLHQEMPYILRVVQATNLLLNKLIDKEEISPDSIWDPEIMEIGSFFQHDSGRAINTLFKFSALKKVGVKPKVLDWFKSTYLGRAYKIRSDFGYFTDIGEFDISKAMSKLETGWTDWWVSDEEAMAVLKMLGKVAPASRDRILLKLDEKGKLDTLLSNLPWAYVKMMYKSSKDSLVRILLKSHFEGKGGGQSLNKVYERQIMSSIKKKNYVRGYLWTFLKTAHNALTLNFLDTYSQAYDAHERGLISTDKFYSTTAAALARTAAVLAASMFTGGAAGGFVSGAGRSLGMSRAASGVLGNVTGGAAAGLSGTFTADIINMSLLGQKGFSPGSSYLTAAFSGAGLGLIPSAGQLMPKSRAGFTPEQFAAVHPWRAKLVSAGEKIRASEFKTGSIYAEKHPWLYKLTSAAYKKGLQTGDKRIKAGDPLLSTKSIDNALSKGFKAEGPMVRIAAHKGLTQMLTKHANKMIATSTKGQLRREAALSQASVDELGILSKRFTNLRGSVKNFPGVRQLNDNFFAIENKNAFIKKVNQLYRDSGNPLHPVIRYRILTHIGDGTKQFPTQAGIPGLHAEIQSVNHVMNQLPKGFNISKINVATIKLAPGEGQGKPFPACTNCGGVLSDIVNITTGVK